MIDKNQVTLKDVYQLINDLRTDMKASYVQKAEFLPVKSIVYGFVGLVLVAVISAMLSGSVKAQ